VVAIPFSLYFCWRRRKQKKKEEKKRKEKGEWN